MTYNVTLGSLSKALGTLLTDRGIVVAGRVRAANPRPVKNSKTDDKMTVTSFEPTQNVPSKREAAVPKPKLPTFSISIGNGNPLEIKGKISVDD